MSSPAANDSASYIPNIQTIFCRRHSEYSDLSAAEKSIVDNPVEKFNAELYGETDGRHPYADAHSTGLIAIKFFEFFHSRNEETAFVTAFEKAVSKWAEETSEEERKEQKEKGYDMVEWLARTVKEGSNDLESQNRNFRRLRNTLNALDFGEAKESDPEEVIYMERLEVDLKPGEDIRELWVEPGFYGKWQGAEDC